MGKGQIDVLHVDDEPDFAELTATFLERESDRYAVETATSADEGLETITDRPPDCVVSDYNMPGMDGLEFLRTLREEHPDLPFILFTGKGSEAVASDAISAGVTDYLQKGSGTSHYTVLANRISNAVEATRSAAKVEQRRHRLEQILKTVPGCVVQCDADGQFVFANERAEEVLGLEIDEVTQRAYNDPGWELQKLNGEPIPDEELPFRQVCDAAEPIYDATHTITWSDGSRKTLSVNAAPLFDETGTVESVVASLNDITDRRERQQELRRNKRAMDEAPIGITISDPSQDGYPLTYVNDRFAELTGYDSDEIVGRNWQFLHGDNTREEPVAQIREAIDAQNPVTVELRNYRKDGTEFWNRVSIAPVRDDQGTVVNFVGFQQDVTERRQTERDLREKQDLVTGIGETVPVGISVHDTDGGISFINERMESISGRSFEELEGTPYDDSRYGLVDEHGEPLGPGDAPFDHVVSRETAIHNQIVGSRRPSGERVWLSVHGAPQYNDSGELERAVFAFEDITERREHEQELRRLKEEYESVFNNVQDSLFLWDVAGSEEDPEFRLRRVNPANAALTGMAPGEALNKTPTEVFPEEVANQFNANYERCLERGEPISYEERLDVEDGPRTYETTLTPVEIDGETAQIAGVAHDITARKERERELKRERDRLDQFASIVAHDLRNPLHVASARLELASEECESTHLSDAAGALDRMETLIDDVLTIAREGTPVQETEIVAVQEVAEDCWSVVETGEATLRTDSEQRIQADPGRLKQLLENLARNAVDHGGDGVAVTVGELAGGFYVADDGTGIPAEEREEVFEMGYSTADSGTGFGLNIVQEIVEAHEWEISVTDSDGGGAQFEITGVETL